jgi:hypothetical protein
MNGDGSGADRHDDASPSIAAHSISGCLGELSLNGIKSLQLAYEEADYKDVRAVE